MAEQGNQNLQQAEQLLREGRKQEARAILVDYVRGHPSSTRGWWMLSFALSDPKHQVDCVERVLRLDPNYAPAHARLEKLKRSAEPTVLPFVESAPSQPAKPTTRPSAPRSVKKTNNQILQYAVLAVMACAAVGVLGFAAVMIVRGMPGAPMQLVPTSQLLSPTPVTPISLPPTWTPTSAPTLAATQTLAPTVTPPVIPTLATPTPFILPTVTISAAQIAPIQGSYAPDFKLTNVATNKKVQLSDYKGKAVLVFFWATWCPYCEAEMPEIQKVYEEYQNQGFVVLAVDVGETAGKARKYRNKHSLTFPVLNDDGSDVSSKYRVSAFPSHFFVRPSGVISSVDVGSFGYAGLAARVKALLSSSP
jgi:cytochrome c biogenesis protein CcmG, thiol:disulfide interchange protein DsbE